MDICLPLVLSCHAACRSYSALVNVDVLVGHMTSRVQLYIDVKFPCADPAQHDIATA